VNDAVLITGIGAVSPLGVSAAALAARCAAGDSALAPLPGVDGAYGAMVADLPLDAIPPEARTRIGRLDRVCRLFLSAASLAVDDARLDMRHSDAERVGLSFGTGLGCLLTNAEFNEKVEQGGPPAASPRLFAYTVSSAAAGEVSIALGIKGVNVTAHQGFAAGLGALGYGYDLIRSGKADVVVAGGADALGNALVQGLADMGLLKRVGGAASLGDCAPGICPSEGAAVLVLERADHARGRGARGWARIAGYAAGFEPTLTRRERAPTALVETMRAALQRSGHTPADVGLVIGSAHATAVDDIERAALTTVFAGAPPPVVLAPKAAWGECFAAHGALCVALAAAQLREPNRFEATQVAYESGVREGPPQRPNGERPRRTYAGRSPLVMVHTLCYSGPTVALLLAPEE